MGLIFFGRGLRRAVGILWGSQWGAVRVLWGSLRGTVRIFFWGCLWGTILVRGLRGAIGVEGCAVSRIPFFRDITFHG